jgi:hypothetical protein
MLAASFFPPLNVLEHHAVCLQGLFNFSIKIRQFCPCKCPVYIFLGEFAKFRKANISLDMSVRLSAWKIGSHLKDFREICYLSIFRKYVEKIQVSLKSDRSNGYFTWRPMYVFDHISVNSCYMRKFSDKSCRESQNTHFMFNNFFSSSKIVLFMRWCGKIV